VSASPGETADRVLALARSRPPTLGDGRLICVDGPAGSGKTTLAGDLSTRTGAPIVHVDDLLEGWDRLPTLDRQVRPLLEPLSRGEAGHWRRWDCVADRRAEEHRLDPAPLLVLEGVGSGNRAWAAWCTALVWVETDPGTRLARGLARDGEAARPHWERWTEDEAAMFAREHPRDRAALVVTT
jgi:uridine kinase